MSRAMGGMTPGPHESAVRELDDRSPARRTVIDHAESSGARCEKAREDWGYGRNPMQDRLRPADKGRCLSIVYRVRRPDDGVAVQCVTPTVDPYAVVLEPGSLKDGTYRNAHVFGLRVTQLEGIVHWHPCV